MKLDEIISGIRLGLVRDGDVFTTNMHYPQEIYVHEGSLRLEPNKTYEQYSPSESELECGARYFRLTDIALTANYTLKQKYVRFDEALKAVYEGKTVRRKDWHKSFSLGFLPSTGSDKNTLCLLYRGSFNTRFADLCDNTITDEEVWIIDKAK